MHGKLLKSLTTSTTLLGAWVENCRLEFSELLYYCSGSNWALLNVPAAAHSNSSAVSTPYTALRADTQTPGFSPGISFAGSHVRRMLFYSIMEVIQRFLKFLLLLLKHVLPMLCTKCGEKKPKSYSWLCPLTDPAKVVLHFLVFTFLASQILSSHNAVWGLKYWYSYSLFNKRPR